MRSNLDNLRKNVYVALRRMCDANDRRKDEGGRRDTFDTVNLSESYRFCVVLFKIYGSIRIAKHFLR